MNENDSQHVFGYVRVRAQRSSNEIVDSGGRFDPSKPAPPQQQMSTEASRYSNRSRLFLSVQPSGSAIAWRRQGLHCESVFPRPRNGVKIRDRSETQNEVVEIERVMMLIK